LYIPPHFAVPEKEALYGLIEAHPLGILITNSNGVLDANHIPFELDRSKDGQDILNCHVARKNPVWEELRNGDEVMVIFRGGEATSPRIGIRASTSFTSRCRLGTTWSFTPMGV